MPEHPLFFHDNGTALFGVLHEPDVQKLNRGYVFCSPLLEEKLWAHRVFVSFARVLCSRGCHVLRFDYAGNGDSDGDFESGSLDTYVSNIRAAVAEIRKSSDCLGLLGLRFGASLAALASRDMEMKSLVLWEPVQDGKAYARELLRINIATQSAVFKKIRHNTQSLLEQMGEGQSINVDGYELKWPLYEGIASFNINSLLADLRGEALIVDISRKPREPWGPDSPKGELVCVSEDPFWKELPKVYSRADNLFQATLAWLDKHD